MVHEAHDSDFHQLLRQLTKELVQHDFEETKGYSLGSDQVAPSSDMFGEDAIGLSLGGTHVLGGKKPDSNTSPRDQALAAALQRLARDEAEIAEKCHVPKEEPNTNPN